jgi:hypothetical protein
MMIVDTSAPSQEDRLYGVKFEPHLLNPGPGRATEPSLTVKKPTRGRKLHTQPSSHDSLPFAYRAVPQAIAFHNQAVELEFLGRAAEARGSYATACGLADRCWGADSPMAVALRTSLRGPPHTRRTPVPLRPGGF